MRRIALLVLAGVALLATFSPPPAEAATESLKFTAAHNTMVPLQWRSHRTGAALLVGGGLDPVEYVDSLTFSRGAAGNVVAGFDTTVGINIVDALSHGALGGLDTLTCRIILEDAGASGSLDSLYALFQVGTPGGKWVDAGGTIVALLPLTGGANALLGVSAAAVKAYTWRLPLQSTSTAQAPGLLNLAKWPLIRMIVGNDVSAVAVTNLKGYAVFNTVKGD